jgi:hypothetical protein
MKYDSRSNLLFVAGGQAAEEPFTMRPREPRSRSTNSSPLTPILYRVALGPRGKPSENFGKPCARNGPRCRSGALLTRAAPQSHHLRVDERSSAPCEEWHDGDSVNEESLHPSECSVTPDETLQVSPDTVKQNVLDLTRIIRNRAAARGVDN